MIEFNSITWASGRYFGVLILALLIVVALLIYQFFLRKKLVRLLSSEKFQKIFLTNFSFTKSFIKIFFSFFGLLFLALAIARPQWQKESENTLQEGRDLLIALDISRSMLAQDVKPDRLSVAREKIKKIMQSLNSDRVGLIVFSQDAFLLCPLTNDESAFSLFLDSVTTETLSSGSTAIDKPILKSIDIWNSMEGKKNKILVILTDGEDFGENLKEVETKAKEIGLHIFTMGIGTKEGGPIPILDEEGKHKGFQKDQKGDVVISRLDENKLKKISSDTGAHYIKASPDDSDVNFLINKIEKFEKDQYKGKAVAVLQEKYYYFAWIGFVLLLLEWLI